jgi:hypothetical protein
LTPDVQLWLLGLPNEPHNVMRNDASRRLVQIPISDIFRTAWLYRCSGTP